MRRVTGGCAGAAGGFGCAGGCWAPPPCWPWSCCCCAGGCVGRVSICPVAGLDQMVTHWPLGSRVAKGWPLWSHAVGIWSDTGVRTGTNWVVAGPPLPPQHPPPLLVTSGPLMRGPLPPPATSGVRGV